MANNFEIVTLDRDETVSIALPFHQLTIVNARCLPSHNDNAVVILNKLNNKLHLGRARSCLDEAQKE